MATFDGTRESKPIDRDREHDKGFFTQDTIGAVVAVGVIVSTIIATGAIFLIRIPDNNQTLVGQAIGTLFSLTGVIVAFFYGSSAGQRKTQDTLNTMANTAKTAQAALPPVAGLEADKTVTVGPGETAAVTGSDTPQE